MSQNSAGVAGSPEEPDAFGHALSASDFNGDGFSDLAIGVPHEKIGTSHSGEAAGAVNILYGSEDGLIGDATEPVWNQNSPAIAGSSEYGDNFGRSLASGDFNGDGRGDLAVGVPFEQIGDSSSGELAGAVNVLYGSEGGIRADANEPIWNQNTTGIAGVSEYGDNFGHALAAGDFNRDGFDDLAIGIPLESVSMTSNDERLYAGAVNVLYGSGDGLKADSTEPVWSQKSAGISGDPMLRDKFGYALEAADFDGDGFSDLAIGVPGEVIGTEWEAGGVNVLYGSIEGLAADSTEPIWNQNIIDVAGSSESGDHFGNSLASGDFNRDGFDDLAIGVPGEDVDTAEGAGAVNILYGSRDGLVGDSDEPIWNQNMTVIAGSSEPGDNFGFSLAAGDFDGDGYSDLAIGVPGEDIGTADGADAGAVNILYGSRDGLTGDSDEPIWNQNTTRVADTSEPGDGFGYSLVAGDFNRDGFDDLAIGVPSEDIVSKRNAGAVNVLLGGRRL